jgi:hypothetical protein
MINPLGGAGGQVVSKDPYIIFLHSTYPEVEATVLIHCWDIKGTIQFNNSI